MGRRVGAEKKKTQRKEWMPGEEVESSKKATALWEIGTDESKQWSKWSVDDHWP